MPSTEKVLLVDDDANILSALQRRLRRKFDIETALCGEEGETAINFLGPFAVIVSDMSMPRVDGADFLSKVLQQSPDTVRIMLTGNADQATAARAVNEAHVYRFLNKPCEALELEDAIADAIEEHRRIVSEREMMSQTVHGVVAMLSKVLSLVSPVAFGRANRLKILAAELAEAAEIDEPWELEIAATLSQLGAVTMPESLMQRLVDNQPLTDDEQQLAEGQFRVAAGLVSEAPRLEAVARVVELQSTDLEPNDGDPPRIVRNANLLSAMLAFESLTASGRSGPDVLLELSKDSRFKDQIAIDALRKTVAKHDQRRVLDIEVNELADGMRLIDDVSTTDGITLVAKGHDVTESLRLRLQNYASTHSLKLPLRALMDQDLADRVESMRSHAHT